MSGAPAVDVAIIGGGVMGCAAAFELSRAGIVASVFERAVPGAEASSAAAGMLGAQVECHDDGPFVDLSIASRARFASWSAALKDLTGVDVEYRPSGILHVAFADGDLDALAGQATWQAARGLAARALDGDALRALEPRLSDRVARAILYPDDGRIDPPKYLRALRIAGEKLGARFVTGAHVRRVRIEEDRVCGVELEDGSLVPAGHVVVAAGSWSGLLGDVGLQPNEVIPARGQIVELLLDAPIVTRPIVGPRAYVSPRDDGRVLLGSTLEFVGYDRRVTAEAVATLIAASVAMLPDLGDAAFSRAWSNFRPYTRDLLPRLGGTHVAGLCLATGHHRNGILLSPITAEIVKACVTGEAPPLDVTPFRPLAARA